MFLDEITLRVEAGNGGDGVVHFRREKFIPRGGPDGGDGGRGGDVVFEVRDHLNTLFHLRHEPRFRAQDGEPGGGNNCSGLNGRDLVIPVPPGTLIKDPANNVVLKDLKVRGQRVVLCQGGRGGRGNKAFATAVNRTPRESQPGGHGQTRTITLELRLIADAGCVGLPNAGKSTLVARCSAARPKIASYPFTTLHPMLGIVGASDYRSFVIADLPGLIEGAHAGAGLGDQFLRHIDRTRIVLHLIDGAPLTPPAPVDAYHTIRDELAAYSPTLASKPEIVVVNKMDLPEAAANLKSLRKALRKATVFPISAVTGEGIHELVEEVFKRLTELANTPAPGPTVGGRSRRSAPNAPKSSVVEPPSRRQPLHHTHPAGPKPARKGSPTEPIPIPLKRRKRRRPD